MIFAEGIGTDFVQMVLVATSDVVLQLVTVGTDAE